MIEKPLEDVEKVPWTIQQTFAGIVLTLVPWLVFAFGLSSFSTKTPSTAVLPPQVDLVNAIITFIFSSLIEAAFLIAPFYYASRAYRGNDLRTRLAFHSLGFRRFHVGKALLLVVLFFFGILLVNQGYQALVAYLHLNVQTNDQVILQRGRTAPLTTYATLIASVVVAPFCEEVFFRGFVFMGLRRAMSAGWAILASALIFGIAHGDPGSFIVLFCIGLALAFLRWYTGSIWPSILLHTLNNGIGALLIALAIMGKVSP